MNRNKFVSNTALDLWRIMVGYEELPMSLSEMHDTLKENPLVSSYKIEMVDGFHDRLSIVMKNGDSFTNQFFNY